MRAVRTGQSLHFPAPCPLRAATPEGSVSSLPGVTVSQREETAPSLTCTGLPVVGLAHPFVAFAQGPEVHARLAHVTDADPAVAPAPAVAQSAPWGLPGRPAPALGLGPGQPARGTWPASAWATNHSRALVKHRHGSYCSEPTLPPNAHQMQTEPQEAPHCPGGQASSRSALVSQARGTTHKLSPDPNDHDPKCPRDDPLSWEQDHLPVGMEVIQPCPLEACTRILQAH